MMNQHQLWVDNGVWRKRIPQQNLYICSSLLGHGGTQGINPRHYATLPPSPIYAHAQVTSTHWGWSTFHSSCPERPPLSDNPGLNSQEPKLFGNIGLFTVLLGQVEFGPPYHKSWPPFVVKLSKGEKNKFYLMMNLQQRKQVIGNQIILPRRKKKSKKE